MKTMPLRFLAILFFSLALRAPGYCEEFTVAAIVPLSGSEASMGSYLKNGIQLAYDSLPEEDRARVKLIFEDDQFLPSQTVTAYQKLKSTNHLNAVFVLGSSPGNALAPIADRDKIPLVAIGASDANIVKRRQFSFIHWVTPEAEAKVLAEEIKKRDYKRIGFVTHVQEGAIAITEALLAALEVRGMKDRVVLDERVLRTTKDFRDTVAKLKNKNVDAVFLMLFPEAIATLSKELRSAGFKADFFGAETFEDQSLLRAANGTLDNQWYVNVASAVPSFEANYKKAFGAFSSWGAANAYDTMKLMVDALKASGGDVDKTVSYLVNLKDYSGAAGTYSGSPDHRFSLPAAVKIVTKDGFKELRDVKASAQ